MKRKIRALPRYLNLGPITVSTSLLKYGPLTKALIDTPRPKDGDGMHDMRKTAQYKEGFTAGMKAEDKRSNPYKDSPADIAWSLGWIEGQHCAQTIDSAMVVVTNEARNKTYDLDSI